MASPQSTKFAAFQFYPGDFLSSSKVQSMSLAERGAYITLLCFQWLDGSLPSDLPTLARMLRIPVRQMDKLWDGPLPDCFTVRGARMVNARLERTRKALAEYVGRQREQGRKGGLAKARYSAASESLGNKASERPSERLANSTSSSSSSISSSTSVRTEESSEPLRDSTPLVMNFPTVGKVHFWELHQSHVEEWAKAYPNIDVSAECFKAHAWIGAHPDKRKTARGMPAFLVGWLNRAVDSPRASAGSNSSRTAGNPEALRRFVARGQAS